MRGANPRQRLLQRCAIADIHADELDDGAARAQRRQPRGRVRIELLFGTARHQDERAAARLRQPLTQRQAERARAAGDQHGAIRRRGGCEFPCRPLEARSVESAIDPSQTGLGSNRRGASAGRFDLRRTQKRVGGRFDDGTRAAPALDGTTQRRRAHGRRRPSHGRAGPVRLCSYIYKSGERTPRSVPFPPVQRPRPISQTFSSEFMRLDLLLARPGNYVKAIGLGRDGSAQRAKIRRSRVDPAYLHAAPRSRIPVGLFAEQENRARQVRRNRVGIGYPPASLQQAALQNIAGRRLRLLRRLYEDPLPVEGITRRRDIGT